MVIGIVGIIIGLLVLGAEIYYLVKEKNDPWQNKAPNLPPMAVWEPFHFFFSKIASLSFIRPCP